MRIKWIANFEIEDSTVQLAEAFIQLVSYENINSTCKVNYVITDETEKTIVKSVSQLIDRNFANETEVYEHILTEYENSEIVD